MASEDLLKNAVAAFNALSPEQQAEMLEKQRQSWVRGNVGLSRDERDMTSPMMRALKIVRETNDKGRQALQAWADSKTRPAPAATDTGLETVGYAHRGTIGLLLEGAISKAVIVPKAGGDFKTPVMLVEQAEELLAAKDADMDRVLADNRMCLVRIAELEADNAELTVRVKELEDYFSKCISNETFLEQDARRVGQIEALGAKLAAAQKVREAAIELDEAISDDFNIFGAQQKLRAVLGGKP